MQDRPRKFYEKATVETVDEGFVIQLDGRTLKTPGKATLRIAQDHVAHLIAAEWNAQDTHILPETMPVTRLVNVAIELTPDNRPKLIEEARNYAGTDLLCYRADSPEALKQRQSRRWDPVLKWVDETHNVSLATTQSALAVDQNTRDLDRVADYAVQFDDLHLTLFVHLVAVFGSSILAMAVMDRHMTGSQAFELSRLDADWQIEDWGEDEEAKGKTDALRAEINSLCKILET